MPDATYVGAGMPCGNCGNPLTLGQPHKCGRTPDQPRDDGTHGTRWLAGKLPPDKEVVLAHHYDDLLELPLYPTNDYEKHCSVMRRSKQRR